MNTDTRTRETVTTTTTPRAIPAAAPGPVRRSWLTALREAIRTRRAHRSELSRQIASYPATRSAAAVVLPAAAASTARQPAATTTSVVPSASSDLRRAA